MIEYGTNADVPLIEHWDGKGWHIATPPPVPGHSTVADLLGVTVNEATGQVWAVGDYWNRKRDEALPLVYQRVC